MPALIDTAAVYMKHNLEAHSLNSLAVRLKLLVSRGTLKRWLDEGRLKPAQHFKQTENGSSRHLIFRTSFLDKLLEQLGEKYTNRLKKLAKKNGDVLRYHASAQANAVRLFELNKKRRQKGEKEMAEPDPALNDDAARGVVRLTRDPAMEKNTFTITNKALGLYR